MRNGRDDIDLLCEQWAIVRRHLLGFREPLEARQYLGSPHCTLAEKRDLHAGARSQGRVVQHFPEVYEGAAFEVNAAFHAMPPDLQQILDVHYVVDQPRDKRLRADMMGISRSLYWDRVGRAKSFIAGAFALKRTG